MAPEIVNVNGIPHIRLGPLLVRIARFRLRPGGGRDPVVECKCETIVRPDGQDVIVRVPALSLGAAARSVKEKTNG